MANHPSIIGTIEGPGKGKGARVSTPPDTDEAFNTGSFNPDVGGIGTRGFVGALRASISNRARHYQITPRQFRELLGWS